MPNQVKHATSTPNHSLHKGEVAIGVNSVGMGPTSSTGWYNGHTPSSGNYIIFQTHTSGDPNIWVTNTPSELYQVVTTLGGGANDITSIGVALSWIASQEDLLAINSSLPNIVTDDLRFYWDAKLISSYSTEGVDWYDLSGKNNTGELQNGPSFNPNGYFEFDGVDDRTYQSSPDLELTNNACTLEILIKQTGTSSGYYRFFTQSGGSSGFGTYPLGIRGSDGFLVTYLGDTGNWAAGRPNYPDGTRALKGVNAKWLHLCVVADLDITGATNRWVYLNGRKVNWRTQTWNGTLPNGAGALYAAANPMGGVASMKIYNKALSQSEVNQNYYQAPIVTDGLIRALDFSNLVSYESGSSSGYDLTGNDTFDLINDPIYTSDFGGGLICDATDDFIVLGDVTATDYVSAECWFRNDINDSSENIIFNKESSWEVKEQNGILQWALLASNRSWFWSNANVSVGEGEMCHIVLTYDGNYVKFYFNGVETVSYTYPSGGVLASQTSCYPKLNSRGCTRTSPSSLGNKSYFQFRIYDRALTNDEVSQNFQAQSSRFI